MSLLPDGTIPVAEPFQRVDDINRRRISEFEQRRDWDGPARFAEENVKLDKSNSDWWTVAGYAYSQAGKRKGPARATSRPCASRRRTCWDGTCSRSRIVAMASRSARRRS